MNADSAPEKSHITVRHGSVEFYEPELFPLSPLAGQTVTLLITDLLNSSKLTTIYGSRVLPLARSGCFLIGNYPVISVRIRGNIQTIVHKPSGNFVILKVEDYSNTNLIVSVKVDLPQFLGCGLHIDSCQQKYIEVRGIWVQFKLAFELHGLYIKILPNELATELNHWHECLESRKIFETPWYYVPEKLPVEKLSGSQTTQRPPSPDIEIISVTNLVSETQVMIEILKFLIQQKCLPTKLSTIYKSPTINRILDAYTTSKIDHHTEITTHSQFVEFKFQQFHELRHQIQKTGLIQVTKTQTVICQGLSDLTNVIQLNLNKIMVNPTKCFNLENFLRVYESSNAISLHVQLLNGIVDAIISDKANWTYNKERGEWIYKKSYDPLYVE